MHIKLIDTCINTECPEGEFIYRIRTESHGMNHTSNMLEVCRALSTKEKAILSSEPVLYAVKSTAKPEEIMFYTGMLRGKLFKLEDNDTTCSCNLSYILITNLYDHMLAIQDELVADDILIAKESDMIESDHDVLISLSAESINYMLPNYRMVLLSLQVDIEGYAELQRYIPYQYLMCKKTNDNDIFTCYIVSTMKDLVIYSDKISELWCEIHDFLVSHAPNMYL